MQTAVNWRDKVSQDWKDFEHRMKEQQKQAKPCEHRNTPAVLRPCRVCGWCAMCGCGSVSSVRPLAITEDVEQEQEQEQDAVEDAVEDGVHGAGAGDVACDGVTCAKRRLT